MTRTADEMASVLCREAIRIDRALGRQEIADAVGAVMKRYPLERYSDLQAEAMHGELRKHLAIEKIAKLKREMCPAEPAPRAVAKREAPASVNPRTGPKNTVTVEKRTPRDVTILAVGGGPRDVRIVAIGRGAR